MPVLTFEGPIIKDIDVKRKLAQNLTTVLSDTFPNIPKDAFIVQIKENAPENIGVGGSLLADRWKS
ncbi:MAG: tautomerase family protein [Candidatus Cloacimonetes bacterium]|nr:tautomerase family protein [Candidatus Cloacimonadota bacterium]